MKLRQVDHERKLHGPSDANLHKLIDEVKKGQTTGKINMLKPPTLSSVELVQPSPRNQIQMQSDQQTERSKATASELSLHSKVVRQRNSKIGENVNQKPQKSERSESVGSGRSGKTSKKPKEGSLLSAFQAPEAALVQRNQIQKTNKVTQSKMSSSGSQYGNLMLQSNRQLLQSVNGRMKNQDFQLSDSDDQKPKKKNNVPISQESLFLQLQSQQPSYNLPVNSQLKPDPSKNTKASQRRQTKQTSLAEIPQGQKFFDMPVRADSPNRVNDSFYEEPKAPNVIAFNDDDNQRSVNSSQKPASNSLLGPYRRPPSCKSSNRSKSKDGTVMDKGVSLNQLAMMKKSSQVTSQVSNQKSDRGSSCRSGKKEGCLMQYFHSDSEDFSRSRSREAKKVTPPKILQNRQPARQLNEQKSPKQKPKQLTSPKVLKRNVYHIDNNGRLIKGDIYIKLSGKNKLNYQSGPPEQFTKVNSADIIDQLSVISGSRKSLKRSLSKDSRSNRKKPSIQKKKEPIIEPSKTYQLGNQWLNQEMNNAAKTQNIRKSTAKTQSPLDEFLATKTTTTNSTHNPSSQYFNETKEIRFNDMFKRADAKKQHKKLRRMQC